MENVLSWIKINRSYIFWGFLAILFKLLPLVHNLHVEACMLLAGISFFVGGLAVILQKIDKISDFCKLIVRHFLGLSLSGFILLLPFPCPDVHISILLFFLFPVTSLLLGATIGWGIQNVGIKNKKASFVIITLCLLLFPPLYDLGFHPQMYHYNHVFGGVLNPIYDEELAIRKGFFWFRGLSLLWAIVIFLSTLKKEKPIYKVGFFAGLFLLFLGYLNVANLGIVTTYKQIEKSLGAHLSTQHFDIWYDKSETKKEVVQRWAIEHEYNYHRIAQKLGFKIDQKVQSYIYPTADRKAEITGARWTNVSPVWLKVPQIHTLNQSQEVMPHELAHVFSRKYGLKWLNASWFVGLVEGFAVSLEQEKGIPKPNEQLALFFDDNGLKNLAENMELTLSPQGFWSGRGAVSYTQSGGFVSFLIEKYGINKFGKVYAKGDFLNVYDKSLQSLLAEWVLYLKLLRKNIQQKKWAKFAADFTQKRFSVPSLFEQKCPHCVLVNQKKAEQAWHLMQPYQPKINPNEMIRLLQDNPEGTAVWVEFCIKQKDFDKAALLLQKLPLGNLKSSLEARLLYQKGTKQKAMVALKKVAQEIPYFARRTKAEIRRMLYLLENDLPIEVLPQTSFLRFEQAIEKYRKTEAQNIAQEALKNAEDELMRRFWQQKREMLVQF